jgi:hypothetical protein
MNHDESIFTLFLRGGPLQLLVATLISILAFYHFALSLRIILRRRLPITAGFHALLLFASPTIVVLLVFVLVPTTLPIFLVGIDADEPIRHSLGQTSFFGGLCLFTFIPNMLLAIIALLRSERSA